MTKAQFINNILKAHLNEKYDLHVALQNYLKHHKRPSIIYEAKESQTTSPIENKKVPISAREIYNKQTPPEKQIMKKLLNHYNHKNERNSNPQIKLNSSKLFDKSFNCTISPIHSVEKLHFAGQRKPSTNLSTLSRNETLEEIAVCSFSPKICNNRAFSNVGSKVAKNWEVEKPST